MRKPHRKPTLPQYMRKQIETIRKAFRVPMRITIICRHPTDKEAEVVFTDDNMDTLIEVLTRRRDEVVASQAASSQDAA